MQGYFLLRRRVNLLKNYRQLVGIDNNIDCLQEYISSVVEVYASKRVD